MRIPFIRMLAALSLSGGVAAAAGIDTGNQIPSGWQTLDVPGKPATNFRVAPNGAIKVSATDSAGFLYRKLPADATGWTRLSWRWRVDMTPPPSDQAMKGMDDRPLAIHVWFDTGEQQSGHWSLFERIGAWLLDRPLPGKVLTYVWGGIGERGDSVENPYLGMDGRIIILRPGNSAVGQWFVETVNIRADFERAFGYNPPKPKFIAISADTDDKRGISMGAVASIGFDGE